MNTCNVFGLGGGCIFPPEWFMILLCIASSSVYLVLAYQNKPYRKTYILKAVNILLFSIGFYLAYNGATVRTGRIVLRVLLATLLAQDMLIHIDVILAPWKRLYKRVVAKIERTHHD